MSNNTLDRLAPFIQEYIYRHRWTEFRPVQVEAFGAVFDTDSNILLTSGTASGKTEAALLPTLTLLHQKPSKSIGILYIGPLKALINDQFNRLEGLLRETDLKVHRWHGDVARSHKAELLRSPGGVLQITPESIEGLLLRRSHDIHRMFCDLRFVIIDEVHGFMASDRGNQILCQLQRLNEMAPASPRRIGLSATLGEPEAAGKWLGLGTGRGVFIPKAERDHRNADLAMALYDTDANRNERLFDIAQRHLKCLVFATARMDVESATDGLRTLAKKQGLRNVYHAHHGSISATLREAAEEAMRTPNEPSVCVATMTLELGIDIGHLDRVAQLGSCGSVSSFVQRLGRSGRRGGAPGMSILIKKPTIDAHKLPHEHIPWELVETVAIIQLYRDEGWIEPLSPSRLPFSLLYHQTMSVLAQHAELSPSALARKVLTLPPFSKVTQDQYRVLLRHLLQTKHLEQTEEGTLIVGLTGERVVKDYHFYAVFQDDSKYAVNEGATQIGTIAVPVAPGGRLSLAGYSWEVVSVDEKRRSMQVKRVRGEARTPWNGTGKEIHTGVLKKMRAILSSGECYEYLDGQASELLDEGRKIANEIALLQRDVLPLGGGTYVIFPWVGSVGFRTLLKIIPKVVFADNHLVYRGSLPPYYLTVSAQEASQADILAGLCRTIINTADTSSLLADKDPLQMQKFDPFLPESLLRQAFATNHLSLDDLKVQAQHWSEQIALAAYD